MYYTMTNKDICNRWRSSHRDEYNDYIRTYYAKNKDRILQQRKVCYLKAKALASVPRIETQHASA